MTKTAEITTRAAPIPAGAALGIATAACVIALSLVTVACGADAPAAGDEDAARLDRRGCLAASARARHHTGRSEPCRESTQN